MKRRRSRWLWGALAAVLAVLLGGFLLLNSPIGKRMLADRIAEMAPASGLKIEIGRIDGDLFGKAVLHDVTLSDPTGPFLTLPEARLDWRPYRWLWAGLDIRQLEAEGGTLTRIPQLLPGDPDVPILPDFDIRIDRLRITNLNVAKGVIDNRAHRVDLAARVDIRQGRALVKLDGRLGRDDRLALLLDAEPDRDQFDLDLDYLAPRGGVLAGFAGADAGYRIRALGDGRWSNWNGAIVARRDDQPLAAFTLRNRAGTYRLAGEGYPAGVVDGVAAKALGRKVAVLANGTLAESVLAGRIALRAEGLDATANGAVDLAGNAFDDFKLLANLTDPDLLAPNLRAEEARLSATLDGPFRNVAIDHVLTARRLAFGPTTAGPLVQKGELRLVDGVWTLPLDLTVGAVDTGTAWADPQLRNGTARGVLVLDGADLRSEELVVTFPSAKGRLALRGNLDRGAFGLAGPVSARGLRFENVGTVTAGANIVFAIARNAPWKLDAVLDGQVTRVSNATVERLAGPTIGVRGGLSLGAGRPVLFRDLALRSARLNARLDGKIEGGRTVMTGAGRQAEYGPFRVEATLDGSGPRATLVLANPLPEAGLRDVRLVVAPEGDGLAVAATGQSTLGPFDGAGLLTLPRGAPATLAIRQLEIWRTAVTGSLVLGEGGPSGRLALSGGGVDGTIALAPRGGRQGVTVNVLASNAAFGGDMPIALRRARIEGSGEFGGGRSTFSGNLYGEGVSIGTLFLGRVAAQGSVENGRGEVTAAVSGRRGSRFDLQTNALFNPGQIALAARGSYAGRAIRMPRRAVLVREADGGWTLQRAQINYGKGVMLAEGSLGGGQTALDLHLSRMPLTLLDAVAPDLGLAGTVSGLVDFRVGGTGLPTGSARVKFNGLTRSGLVLTSRPTDLALVARLDPQRFEARASFSQGGDRLGRVQARISGLPSSGNLVDRLRRGALSAQLGYDGPADTLWRLAAVDAFDLSGPIAITARATGTLAEPTVAGNLASDDLRVRSGLSGSDLRGTRVRGSFAGSRLQLSRFSGLASGGGTISGSGWVDLAGLGAKGPSLDLKLAAKGARLLDTAGLGATVTGPLRIVSDGVNGTIAGRVTVSRARWMLGQATAAGKIPQIATREINLPADVAPRRAPAGQWRYLVDARAPGGIEVDGMGLDSEWSGTIRVRGTTAAPRIGGQAQVIRGGYTFAGTQFELTRGRIAFDENVAIDPRLDILAETRRDGTEVEVKVAGRALQPEITFSSEPALPEEEILARLLFGGSINELSATDALQLGAAVASLRGGAGLDPINRLRSAIGLDRLRIVSADPTLGRGTGVALGENIGRRAYVEIVTDGRGYTATEIEYRVTSWLSLLGAISTIGRESVGARISRDY